MQIFSCNDGSNAKDYSNYIPYNHKTVKCQHHTVQLYQGEPPQPPNPLVYKQSTVTGVRDYVKKYCR